MGHLRLNELWGHPPRFADARSNAHTSRFSERHADRQEGGQKLEKRDTQGLPLTAFFLFCFRPLSFLYFCLSVGEERTYGRTKRGKANTAKQTRRHARGQICYTIKYTSNIFMSTFIAAEALSKCEQRQLDGVRDRSRGSGPYRNGKIVSTHREYTKKKRNEQKEKRH